MNLNLKIRHKQINIFVLLLIIFLSLVLLLATIVGSYMFVRSRGQLKNNSLSTKLEAYNIENDFEDFGEKFDDEFNNILFCGIDLFNNTDVIMIISINKRLHSINVLRIPRDTYIGEDYKTGKINAVYSSPKPSLTGADTLTYEINNIFRIKIDKYIFMTLDIFEDMIDDIGGVEIYLENDLKIDSNNIIKSGKIILDGKQGANFVRHRKTYLTGDIGRIHAQEKFVKALGKKLVEDKYLSNISFLNKYYNQIETNIGRKEVKQYTDAVKDIDINKMKTFVLSGVPVIHNKYSVYVIDKNKTTDLLNQYFMPKKIRLTPEDLKLVKYLEPDPVPVPVQTEYSEINTSQNYNIESESLYKYNNINNLNSRDNTEYDEEEYYDEYDEEDIYDYDEKETYDEISEIEEDF